MTHSMYLTIMKLLDKWDELTPIERKVLGHGNHTRLKAQYSVLRVGEDDPGILITKEGKERVLHTGILFDAIKKVHMERQGGCATLAATRAASQKCKNC